MNFDLPGGAFHERSGAPYVCGFVVPVAAKGLRWVCRDKMGGDRAHGDSALSARLDEMDCVAVFDDCLIPWSAVYFFAPASVDVPGMDFVLAGLQHHVLVRSIAKTRFLIGLAHLIAESSRVNQFINVQERLGEMVCFLRALEAFAVAAVADAVLDERTQTYYPNPRTTEIAGVWTAQMYPKMVSCVLDLGGSRYVAATQLRTIDLLGDLAEQHFRGGGESAKDNIALFRLAWEVAGSTWGARQDLYERFHFGDATLRKVGGYLRFDPSAAVSMVRRVLTTPPHPDEVFPIPSIDRGDAHG
jgi:aromatic ring hydroxylase